MYRLEKSGLSPVIARISHDEEHTKFVNLVRYGSTKDTEVKPATYNPFADLKAKMEEKK